MIQMHAIKGKKKEPEPNIWGNDFAFEVESKTTNAEYELLTSITTQQYNNRIIVTNDNGFNEIYQVQVNDYSIKINLPIAGKYYIRCIGTYSHFRLQYTSISIVEFKKILNWGTNEWQNLNAMFNNCSNITSIDFEGANLNNVTQLNTTFYGCSSLTSINFGNNTLENCINLISTFMGCRSLTSINLSNMNLLNVTLLTSAFQYCESLTSINWGQNTLESVTDLKGAFYDCSSLVSLDLSNFDLSNVTDMDDTFRGCTSLENLNFGDNTFENVEKMRFTFHTLNQSKLPDLSKFSLTNLTHFSNNNFSDSAENRTMYEYILSIWASTLPIKSPSIYLNFLSVKATPQAQIYKNQLLQKGYNIVQDGGGIWGDDFVIEIESKTNNATYDLYENGSNRQYNIVVTNDDGYEENYLGKSASNIINLPTAGTYYIRCSGSYVSFQLQYSSINNVEFKNVLNWGTNEWQNLTRMFLNCTNLTTIDLEGADLSKVTDLNTTFGYCSYLTTINFGQNTLGNCTNLNYTFRNCIRLRTIDLSNLDLSNITTLASTFFGCTLLSTIDFGQNTLENCTTLNSTFNNCQNLVHIDLSNLDLSKVTDLRNAFRDCIRLRTIEFGQNTFENVTLMDSTFRTNQAKLPDLSNFLLTKLNNFSNNTFGDSAENRTMYEYILSVWITTLPIKSPTLNLNFNSVKATAQAKIYKNQLLQKGYNITDGGNV